MASDSSGKIGGGERERDKLGKAGNVGPPEFEWTHFHRITTLHRLLSPHVHRPVGIWQSVVPLVGAIRRAYGTELLILPLFLFSSVPEVPLVFSWIYYSALRLERDRAFNDPIILYNIASCYNLKRTVVAPWAHTPLSARAYVLCSCCVILC